MFKPLHFLRLLRFALTHFRTSHSTLGFLIDNDVFVEIQFITDHDVGSGVTEFVPITKYDKDFDARISTVSKLLSPPVRRMIDQGMDPRVVINIICEALQVDEAYRREVINDIRENGFWSE